MNELLEKSVVIARSGVQRYLRRELPALKVGPVPDKHKDKTEFHVYRSAPLIADSKDLFTRKPFIYTHKAYISPANFTDHVQGWIGDTATIEMNDAKTEVTIRADLTIGGEEAIQAYQDRGEREVSPFYFGEFEWEDGVAPDGQPYEIRMTKFTGVNHVALTPAGRGGPDASIQDHDTGFVSGIWRAIRRLVGAAKDETPETFRIKANEIAKARKTYNDQSISQAANVLRECLREIPYSDKLSLLYRYLDDIKTLVEATDEEALKYVELVSDLYEELDKETLNEVLAEAKKEEKEMAKAADEKPEDEEAKKKAAAADEDKEWEALTERMNQSRKDGAKAADWKMGGSKDEDADESEEKDKADKERVKETKDKEKAESKDEDEEEKEKEKKDEKDKAKAEDAFAVYDSAPWTARVGAVRQTGTDPGLKILQKSGYLPTKESK